MSMVAANALTKLLQRAESAWARNTVTSVTLRMSDASFPAYLDLKSVRDKEDFHAAMRDAARRGAIRVEWDDLAGEDGQIRRLVMLDADKTASILGVVPLWQAFQSAEGLLAPYHEEPGVRSLLTAWRDGKRPRGLGPEQADSVMDAIRVISSLRGHGYEDVPVRQLSATLFLNSKHIERKLLPVLDYLTQDDETCTLARHPDDVLATLGLIRFPQPVLIAGRATVRFRNGDVMRLPEPYIGLAPQSVEKIDVAEDARYILMIENFTPFNEIAKGRAGPVEGVVIYTAGMPSPSFIHLFAAVLGSTPPDMPIYHWGDIDLGGFRIADVLAKTAERCGQRLSLWNMNPAKFVDLPKWCELTQSDKSWIRTIATKHGWTDELAGVEETCASYEQEMMRTSIP